MLFLIYTAQGWQRCWWGCLWRVVYWGHVSIKLMQSHSQLQSNHEEDDWVGVAYGIDTSETSKFRMNVEGV
jgi:hypothetical protein